MERDQLAGDAPLAAPEIELGAMRRYRLGRLRAEMRRADIDLAVLTNPVSIRYAVDYRNYQLFQARMPIVYLMVPVEGPVIMFGALVEGDTLIDEMRPASKLSFFAAGPSLPDEAAQFAADVRQVLHEIGAPNGRVAVEHVNPSAVHALTEHQLRAEDAIPFVEFAKAVKSPEEIAALRHAIDVAQLGMTRMRAALRPGVTENHLWSLLHQTNIAHDGEWFDGRSLTSGPRTNSWYQEASSRRVEAGDLVAFDTDMMGPLGYCADISQTWFCGPGKPTPAQRDLYARAYDEVQANMAQLQVGRTFRELSEASSRQPERFQANRYVCAVHGVGLGDEYPMIYYPRDWEAARAYDGVLQAGMCLCVESYIGLEGGPEGVKLEEQVLLTETGVEVLSTYPFEEDLLAKT